MIGNQLNHSKIIELHLGKYKQPLKSDSEAYKCFYLIFLFFDHISEMLVTNWKLVTGMIKSTKPSKIIELHCGNTLQPLKSDSEAYKVFFWFFSIISPEMLVTNWKLVTGMIGNQLNHSKIIELHCGNTLQPLKSDSEHISVFSSFRSYLPEMLV